MDRGACIAGRCLERMQRASACAGTGEQKAGAWRPACAACMHEKGDLEKNKGMGGAKGQLTEPTDRAEQRREQDKLPGLLGWSWGGKHAHEVWQAELGRQAGQ